MTGDQPGDQGIGLQFSHVVTVVTTGWSRAAGYYLRVMTRATPAAIVVASIHPAAMSR
jgi:hypothetical protein